MLLFMCMLFSIQYLRIILILFVVAEHVYPLFNTPLSNILKNGSLAVSMFFIISGFFSYSFLQRTINNTYKKYLMLLFKSKISMIIQYYTYIFISFVYLIITHKVNLNIVISLILSAIGVNVFSENFTINGFLGPAWYFQVLIICFVLLPVIHQLIIRFPKIFKIKFLIILHLLLNFIFVYFTDNGAYLSYYFPILRIIQFSIGYLLHLHFIKNKIVVPTKKAIITVMFSIIVLAVLHISTLNKISLVVIESMYVFFNYLLLKGLIQLEITNKHLIISNNKVNKIVLLICKHSFTIYLFHFIILKYTQLLGNIIVYPMHLIITLIVLVLLSEFFCKLTKLFND